MPFQFPVHFLVHGKQLVVDLIEDLVVLSCHVLLDSVMHILKVYVLRTKIKGFKKILQNCSNRDNFQLQSSVLTGLWITDFPMHICMKLVWDILDNRCGIQ